MGRVFSRITLMMVLMMLAVVGYSAPLQVKSISYDSEGNQAQIKLAVSDSPKHRVFVLDNPPRLVIDVKNAQKNNRLTQPKASHPLFSKTRTAVQNGSDLRIVVDLKESVTAKSHKLVTDNKSDGHLSVVLTNKDSSSSVRNKPKSPDNSGNTKQLAEADQSLADVKATSTKSAHSNSKKRFIVAIDAGHGGDDPGARGANGTLEKRVTMAIARKLQGLINDQPGLKAKLVRKGDYYVGLRERMQIARQAHADLFISIHADAVNNPEVRGASVYTLSRNGASNEAARWLANHENAKERLGGVDLEDKDEMLASVLLDLSQTATQQASVSLAGNVLKNFQSIGGLHYRTVQKAGFAVLKSPDIPSILVETAYISNPSDEQNLMSHGYQNKIAHAIFKGVLRYVEQVQPGDVNRVAKL